MASKSQSWTYADQADPGWDLQRLAVLSERLWKPFVYSSAYLAVIAVAEVLIVQFLLGLPPSPAPLIVGLITFAIYANDRLVDIETDAESAPHRTAFVRRYRGLLYVLAALAYGCAVALAVLAGPLVAGFVLFPSVVWVLYAVEWVPAPSLPLPLPFRRLKELFIINSGLIAVAWSATIVFLPIAYANAAVTPAALIIFLYFVLATFVNTEIANVRDIASDRQRGVATLPVVFGVTRTRQALYGITALTLGLLGVAALIGVLTAWTAVALALALVCLAGVIAHLGRSEHQSLLAIAAEYTRVPVFVLLVLAKFG